MQEGALETAIAAAGPAADGLAYCVGSINLKPLSRVTDAEALADFQLNALGAFRAVKAALPALKATTQPSASVLLFSTVAVQQGFASHASVAMAKGAVEGLTRTLAAELAPKVRVNAIAPSLTRTPLASALTASEQTATAIAALHPLQRLGTPDDVAALATLLLSPQSGWITGQVIGVDVAVRPCAGAADAGCCEGQPAVEDMCNLWSPVHLAQEVGKGLGRRKILQ